MRGLSTRSFWAAAAFALAACGVEPPTVAPPEGAEVAASELAREADPDVPAADAEALRVGNTGFALELYRSVRSEAGRDNLFFSPHSVSIALAMTYAGAEGETERQMAEALRFDLPEERLHPAFNALDASLASRSGPLRLHVVNQAWGQAGYPFLSSYLDVLALNYGAGLYLLGFAADAEAARGSINDWVAEQTEGRIVDLLPEGTVDDMTRLVLTNAIYFHASWLYEFDEDATEDAPFHLEDGSEATAAMMRGTFEVPYGEGEGWQAVELPYRGEQLALLAVLPGTDVPELDVTLDAESLDGIVAALDEQEVAVSLPRFSFGRPLDLRPHLEGLGMVDAFDMGAADLSGMDGTDLLYIQAAVHQAFVEVTETGTEAAAATAVVVGERSAASPASITLDRPFFFAIRDRQTGAILFLGRVADPTA